MIMGYAAFHCLRYIFLPLLKGSFGAKELFVIPRMLALLALLSLEFVLQQNPAESCKSAWTPSPLYSQTAARQANKHSSVREGFVTVTGGRVWYKIVGSGRATPLLLLHGGPGFPSDYLTPLEAISNERPVVFYDQLGCGKSDRPSDKSLWKIERSVRELAQVRKALGLENVHILGHSWGTMLATDYLLTRPIGVVSVILAGPALSTKQWMNDADKLRAALPKEVKDTLARHERAGTTQSEEYQTASQAYLQRYVCRIIPPPKELAASIAGMGHEVYETMWGPSEFNATGNLKDYDRSGRLKEISVPTLFTCGRYDEATPKSTAWYQSLVPKSKLVVFENSAHMAMLEERDRYIETIRRFLKEAERK
jgi:proline iminopeptidase